MLFLLLGLSLWMAAHLFPCVATEQRATLIAQYGQGRYRLVFSALIATALALIIYGWRNTTPIVVYIPPAELRHVGMLLVLIAFLLFGAAKAPTRLKRYIRHPQLASVIVWGAAHLMMNGDIRSLLLFAGLGAWAIVNIVLINRRDGARATVEVGSVGREVRWVAISVVLFVVVAFLHPYIAGVPALTH